MFKSRPTIPEYEVEDIGAMLARCRKDPAVLKFVSTVLVAAGFWYQRTRLLMLLQPVIYLGGFIMGYYLADGFE